MRRVILVLAGLATLAIPTSMAIVGMAPVGQRGCEPDLRQAEGHRVRLGYGQEVHGLQG